MFRISIKFLILLVLSYTFAFLQGGNLPYRIFYGFLLTFIFGFLYIITKSRSITIAIKCDKKVYNAGDEHEFVTITKNDGILPVPYIIIKNKNLTRINPKYNGNAIALNPLEIKFVRNVVRFNTRGVYNLGEVHFSISDLFSVFEMRKNVDLNVQIKVYPKIYELNKFIVNGSDIFKNAMSIKTNIEDLYSARDIRKYTLGDNLKRVNWKVSAKHGELYVKELESVSGEESNLILDLGRHNTLLDDNGLSEEQLVDFCISLVNYMQLKGVKTKLFINAKLPKKVHVESRQDFNELMEYFINQSSDGENDFNKFVYTSLDNIPRLSWIGVVVNEIDKFLREELIRIKDRGYNITVFYSGLTSRDLSNVKVIEKIGINCYSFNDLIKKQGGNMKL
jgi:uncharacterized protein (DUF58 family)